MIDHELTIHHATSEDIDMLVPMIVETFRETYIPKSPVEEVERHIARHFQREQIAAELADPNGTMLIAYAEGAPAGYALIQVGSTTPCITGPAPVKLSRIYLRASAIGQGRGAALMQACVDEAVRRGGRTIWLSVWDQNHRAIRFYEKIGFRPAGTCDFEFGGVRYLDPVMAMELP